MGETLLEVSFTGAVVEWRGPAPFHFIAVPEECVLPIRVAAREASYGWGVVPVTAEIGGISFATSLFPRDGGYLLPLKNTVRRATGLTVGSRAEVLMRVARR